MATGRPRSRAAHRPALALALGAALTVSMTALAAAPPAGPPRAPSSSHTAHSLASATSPTGDGQAGHTGGRWPTATAGASGATGGAGDAGGADAGTAAGLVGTVGRVDAAREAHHLPDGSPGHRAWARPGPGGTDEGATAPRSGDRGTSTGAGATEGRGAEGAERHRRHGARGRHTGTQRALDAITSAGAPGALAEVRDSDGTWFGSSGVADLASHRPRKPFDRFRAASVTKTFTATVLLQLAAEGRLHLGDSVDRWLPGLVRGNGNDGRRITLRQLLRHTSGLYNYSDDPELRSRLTGTPFLIHRHDTYHPAGLVRVALSHHPLFAPGSGWSYSNTNYVLAGLVIEKATGRPFATEVRQRIITPLGLRSTAVPEPGSRLPGPHGRHYSRLLLGDPAAPVYDVTDADPSVTGTAAGSLVTTGGDLVRFYGALLGGRLLPPEQMREMFTGVPMGESAGVSTVTGGDRGQGEPGRGERVRPRGSYGLGVFSQELSCGITLWGHDGTVHGSLTWVMGTPGGGRTLALNINGDWVEQRALAVAVSEAEFCGDPGTAGSARRPPAR